METVNQRLLGLWPGATWTTLSRAYGIRYTPARPVQRYRAYVIQHVACSSALYAMLTSNYTQQRRDVCGLTSGGLRGRQLRQLPRAPREEGHQRREGRAKRTRPCITKKHVLDFKEIRGHSLEILHMAPVTIDPSLELIKVYKPLVTELVVFRKCCSRPISCVIMR